MPNPQNLRPFPKGKSGNPKGRPRTAETQKELGELIRAWLNEEDRSKRTNLSKQIRKMAQSVAGMKLLLEYAFGKVPQPIVGGGEGSEPITLLVKYEQKKVSDAGTNNNAAAAAPETDGLHRPPGETQDHPGG